MSTTSQLLMIISILWLITTTNVCSSFPTYLFSDCSNTTTFSPNSTYKSNLNRLLSSLSAAAARRSHNATTAGGAYGLFFCRGDVRAETCHACVASAVADAPEKCPSGKAAAIWYDECQLRYSDSPFFGRLDTNPSHALLSVAEVGEGDRGRFDRLVAAALREAAEEAAAAKFGGGDGRMFGTRIAKFNDFEKLYSLAQCSPDLAGPDCGMCLEFAVSVVPSCCGSKKGGRVVMPSCNVRYELYPFFNLTAVLSPALSRTATTVEKGKFNTLALKVIAPIIASVLLFISGFWFIRRRAVKKDNKTEDDNDDVTSNIESLQFDLATLEAATNGFSVDCKLGEGGFGEVYKGTLANGQEIAVKRLSKSSGQGVVEFKNEVSSLAKLHHRNLVRLLGFCFKGEEKLLVYEYVQNKSLDCFLFDPEKQGELDWAKRYKIIGGVVRGILYLHEDSSLKIIHRDLKASNVLLDAGMNPKISDFGMARIFVVDQSRGSTSRVVGTYGYMSPEYAMRGEYSPKSDVYSFGVLVLEIISGKKNSKFDQLNQPQDLLSYAWKCWKDGTPSKLVDPTILNSYSEPEVVRCIHMGLLCVQDDPEDRPTMASIALMLNSYSIRIPVPQESGFSNRPGTAIRSNVDEV